MDQILMYFLSTPALDLLLPLFPKSLLGGGGTITTDPLPPSLQQQQLAVCKALSSQAEKAAF